MLSFNKSKSDHLADILRDEILKGKLKHGARIPGEIELTERYSVSRDTVRKALGELELNGYLLRIRPRGTFVNHPGEDKRLILVLHPSGEDIAEAYHYIMPGIQDGASRLGLTVEQGTVSFAHEMLAMYGDGIAGVVIFGGRYTGTEEIIQILQNANVPVIMAGCYPEDVKTTGFAGLIADRRSGWTSGILALKNAGHSRIATLSINNVQGFVDAFDEYCDFLAKNDLFVPELIEFTSYNYDSVEKSLQKLWSLPQKPTAIMCYSDFVAMLLLKAASKMNIKIPDDLAVMGFANYPGAPFLSVPLATVGLGYYEIGEQAAVLVNAAKSWFGKVDGQVPEITLPCKLILRESAQLDCHTR